MDISIEYFDKTEPTGTKVEITIKYPKTNEA